MRYTSLDGLRGVAALSVLLSHYCNQTGLLGGMFGHGGGQLGVMLFFSLSGFLMGKLYMHRPINLMGAASFFRARVARVFPLYIAVVLVSFGAYALFGEASPFFPVTADILPHHLVFWYGVEILWTIPVEVQFYLLFPVIWWLFHRMGVSTLWALGLVAAAIMLLHYPNRPMLFGHFHFFAIGIALGSIKDTTKDDGMNGIFVAAALGYLLSFPGVLAAAGLALDEILVGPVFRTPWMSMAHLVVIATLLWAAVKAPWADLVLGHRSMVFVGNVSYSLYLLHIPVLHYVEQIALVQAYPLVFFPLFLAISLGVAWASFRFLETPARKWIGGKRRPSGTDAAPAA